MAHQWYVQHDGEEFGPLTAIEMRALARKGNLTPLHKVRQGTDGKWVDARRVRGLFAEVVQCEEKQRATLNSPTVSSPRTDTPKTAYRYWVGIAAIIALFATGLILQRMEPKAARSPTEITVEAVPVVPFDFQGVSIGYKLTPQFKNRRGRGSIAGLPSKECQITDSIDIEGANVFVLYEFYENKLITVKLVFAANLFDNIVRAYSKKFGTPPHEVTEEKLTNRMGAEFTNTIATWQTNSGPFIVCRYGNSVEKGYAFLSSPEYNAYRAKLKEDSTNNLRKNL